MPASPASVGPSPGAPADVDPVQAATLLERVERARRWCHHALTRTEPREQRAWRREQLSRLRTLLTRHEEELCAAITQDLGRTANDAYMLELVPVLSEIAYFHEHLDDLCADRLVAGAGLVTALDTCFIRPQPKGLVLVISPWNYPIQLALSPVVSAIAAGNGVILKLSEVSVHTSALLLQLMERYMDPDACYTLVGDVPLTTLLLEQPFDHIFYTGNGVVGRIVATAAAKHLCPVTLELGGKSPVYVDRDADLPIVARRVCWTKFLNCGQTCVSPDYVLVHQEVEEAFLEACKHAITELYGQGTEGEAMSACPLYSRIISPRHCQRLLGMLTEATAPTAAGAAAIPRIIVGGQGDAASRYLAPTILSCPAGWSGALMQEEIFGPILPVLPVTGLDQAIEHVTTRPAPLALYTFSRDERVNDRFLGATLSGSAMSNDLLMSMVVQNLPFGGVGASGYGAYHGPHGFHTLSHHRAIMKRPHGWELLNLPRYPLFANSPRFQGALRWLLLRPRALLPSWMARWLGRLLLGCVLVGAGVMIGYLARR